eukprot:TRINITY_DN7157_c0_g1_i1.p1 TRINITY_DN7157_c0_g1~~TRINITY_DN7157_c0_g1_i1.p1  ORF type:complete len:172 (+),score=26.83 TRINITY_DN7157_c0_g1_i1:127-642(+)
MCGRCGHNIHIRCAYCKGCFTSKTDMAADVKPREEVRALVVRTPVASSWRQTAAPLDGLSTGAARTRTAARPAAPTADVDQPLGAHPLAVPWRPAGRPPPMNTAARRPPFVRALETDDAFHVSSSFGSSAARPLSPVRGWHLFAASAAPRLPLAGLNASAALSEATAVPQP